MTPEELIEFREAQVELTTSNRTYCSNVECAAFIPPSTSAKVTGRSALAVGIKRVVIVKALSTTANAKRAAPCKLLCV